MDSSSRSLAKAVSYRILGSTGTALIVLIFSGRGTGDLEREVRALRSDVAELKKTIEAQTGMIKSLQQQVGMQQRAAKEQ